MQGRDDPGLFTDRAREATQDTSRPSVLELFCADGYYSAHAKKAGAGLVTGVDVDKSSLNQAKAVFNILFGSAGDFQCTDVLTWAPKEAYNIVLSCGGLYHLHDPAALVAKCHSELSRKFLLVQSVASLENTCADYFEVPAPGWKHGSRFSRGYPEATIRSAGFRIPDSHESKLEANEQICDRGTAFLLCEL